MSSKFAKPLIFSSALTLGALAFVACGEDSNPSVPPPAGSSSSSAPWIEPEETPTTAIVFGTLGIASQTTSRIKFQGSVSLDLGDSNTVADVNAAVITGVDVIVLKKDTQVPQGVATFVNPPLFPTASTVNFLESGLQTDLDDPSYTECGEFELVITASADDGIIPSVSIARIPFTRGEENCRAPESSSSEPEKAPGAPLKSFQVEVKTKIHKCINVATEQPTADLTGDICFEATSTGSVNLSSGTGLKFAVYDNKNDNDRYNNFGKNYLPEKKISSDGSGIALPLTEDGTAHQTTTDDFLYAESALTPSYTNFMSEDDKFFVAIGPNYNPYVTSATDFYAFIVLESSAPDANGNVEMKLVVYKAK